MSSSTDMDTPVPGGHPFPETGYGAPYPGNWREAVLGLLASRLTLIQLESKDAARDGGLRVLLLVIALGGLFFGWILMLAGAIAWIASAAGWAWYWVALGAALLHFIVAAVLGFLAKSLGKPAFPHTRAEFQKDREWIENFQDNRKSNG